MGGAPVGERKARAGRPRENEPQPAETDAAESRNGVTG